MADLTTFATGAIAYFRGLPAQEREARAKLAELEAELGPARAAHLKAAEARRAARAQEMVIENEIESIRAELAGMRADDPAGQRLAVRTIQLKAVLAGLRGSMPGERLIAGTTEELVREEDRALDRRQTIERAVMAQRDLVDNLRRLRESDAGRDTEQLQEMGMLPPAIKVERHRATNYDSSDR